MGEDGRELKFWDPKFIEFDRDEAVHFSSNGFYLKITNKKEVQVKDGTAIDSPKARYELVAPDGKIVSGGLNHVTGKELLWQKAETYQREQLDLFERQKGGSN